MKRQVVEKVVTESMAKKVVATEGISKSEKIRQLFDGGMDVKQIAEFTGVRYNMVYNVLNNYININSIAVIQAEKADSKANKIKELLAAGKTLAEVSRETKTNYNYVWKLNRELKDEAAAKDIVAK